MRTKINSVRSLTLAAFAIIFTGSAIFIFTERPSAQKIAEGDYIKTEQLAPEAGTITGRVFQDYNSDGQYSLGGGTAAVPLATDLGVAGITVSAYDSGGILRGTATTAADGTYSLAASGTGPYRIEFTAIPVGYTPSARSDNSVDGSTATTAGTTTQFVQDGTTQFVNLGLVKATEYCENNPLLCSQLYAIGSSSNIPDSVFTVPYTSGSTLANCAFPCAAYASPSKTSLATNDQVGTTFGLAYNRNAAKVYAAAFMKKHTKFGPNGTGAIYSIDRATGTKAVHADLNAIFGAGTAGTNLHETTNYDRDGVDVAARQATWDGVGKNSLGGMAISGDGSFLFVMNLANRRLYKVPTSGAIDATTVTSSAFPASLPSCASSDYVRPFAVSWNEGTLYVGAICTNENLADSSPSANFRGYIYTVNPATLAFSGAPVFSFPLDYVRHYVNGTTPSTWRHWRTTWASLDANEFIYPQPMFTDIDFDRGNLIIGLRDRDGDQTGFMSASDPNRPGYVSGKGVTAGEVLRACGSPSTGWTLENDGRCGGTGAAPASVILAGPGGREYYFQDNYDPSGNYHNEVGTGSSVQVPGQTYLATTVFDPPYMLDNGSNGTYLNSGGFRWYDNSTGGQVRGYLAYAEAALFDFGKANGIGNLLAMCSSAPIEIGNRVWRDTDFDGVQDPGEAAIPGVTVHLYLNGVIVGSAVTGANGEYIFLSGTAPDGNPTDNFGIVNGGILPNTAYEIRFDNPVNYQTGGPLFGMVPTTANQTIQAGQDDGSDSDSVVVSNPSGSPAGSFPVIAVTTGSAGQNDHTLDSGFVLAPTAADVTVSGRVLTASGSPIRNAIVTLNEPDGSVHRVVTGSFGYFTFTGIPAGQSVLIDVFAGKRSFTVPTMIVHLDDNVSGINFYANELR